MDKVIREGKVAVLVSRGFGAGWYSWHQDKPYLLFHPEIVDIVEKGVIKDLSEDAINQIIKDDGIYVGGAYQLEVCWVDKDTIFRIDEYDGSETLVTQDNDDWIIA